MKEERDWRTRRGTRTVGKRDRDEEEPEERVWCVSGSLLVYE